MTDLSQLTLDRIFTDKEFEAKSFGPFRWLDDGRGYTIVEPVKEGEDNGEKEQTGPDKDKPKVMEIIRYDTATGERQVLVSAEQLRPEGAEEPLVIKDFAWSDDKKRLLIFCNSKKVWRLETRGDYWVLDLEQGWLKQLGGDDEGSGDAGLMFAKFAPDGHAVAYVRQNNIYVETLDDGGRITQLTTDGAEQLINGTSDWVYEEEFSLRDGFAWSPSGRYIAYWQFDTTGIDTFYMINNTDSLYPKLIPIPYPKVGTTNSAVRVGVVSATGGPTTWFDLPGDPRQHYIPKMEWVKVEAGADEGFKDEAVVIQQLNRLQNRNHVFRGRAADGTVATILVEEDEAWVDVRYGSLKWLDNGRAFLWLSERDGWRHLYRVAADGSAVTLLTPGDYDVFETQAVAEANGDQPGWVYFSASPDDPTRHFLFRAPLAGDGPAERITPAAAAGHNVYKIAPSGEWAFHTGSRNTRPPVTNLVSLPDHDTIRVAEDNQAVYDKIAELNISQPEFFRVDIGDGLRLDAWCIKPSDFDPERRYPVLFYVYGEPVGQTVVDAWFSDHFLWHHMLAQQGYVVMSVDNRGTPALRGREWRKCVYRQVGILSSEDQAAAVRTLLAERPYLDPQRVGVWGWSGGGSMTLNLMFRSPDLYKVGIAVAAVSHQKYYDTVYQERYMGLPDDNEDGYRDGSPITFAEQLEGELLMIHGTADDNVHYQAFEVAVNELIKHNKQFSMMAYPGRSHGIREGDGTTRHLYGLMTRYLQDNL